MISLKISLFTLFIMSVITSASASSDCVEGKTKHIFHNKEVITNENYCYDLESSMLYSTDPCAGEKICTSKNLNPIDFKLSEIDFETGSPGFKVCDKYSGTPQIIDFWAENQWRQSSRCIFSDGSFIDNSSLTQKVNFLD